MLSTACDGPEEGDESAKKTRKASFYSVVRPQNKSNDYDHALFPNPCKPFAATDFARELTRCRHLGVGSSSLAG